MFKGNALLRNERFHSASLFYSKFSMYRGLMVHASANFNKKVRTLRNDLVLDGINQYTTPTITDNPETNWRFTSRASKNIYRFNLGIDANLSWFKYTQTINNNAAENQRNSQDMGIELKTAYKKWPFASLKYTKGFSEFNGLANSSFKTDQLDARLEYEVTPSLTLKAAYENFKTSNSLNQTNRYEIANASLFYQKKNSAWGFEAAATNFLNNGVKRTNSFSDYIISERTTYILPRIFLLSVNYKL